MALQLRFDFVLLSFQLADVFSQTGVRGRKSRAQAVPFCSEHLDQLLAAHLPGRAASK